MDFQTCSRYGYLTSCPTNLGTGLRVSFHIHLPQTGQSAAFRSLCKEAGLAIRSARGEGSEPSDDLYDISNQRRWGCTTTQCIEDLLSATTKIIALERSAGPPSVT